MTANGWFQILLFFAVLLAVTKPIGVFMTRVFSGEKTFLDPVLRPVERLIYRCCGIDETREMDWKEYAISMLLFSVVSMLVLYLIERVQGLKFMPWNPQHLAGVGSDLAFNTAASFTTNTNWQNYGGESTMSYFTQMAGLAYHNFASAGAGIALAIAVIRGIARKESKTIGNFWVDFTRCMLWVLLPACLVIAMVFVSQGMIQNLRPYDTAKLLNPQTVQTTGADGKPVTQTITDQVIAQGPFASQEAIKILGTNGGGPFNANSSHPYENPTPLTDFMQIVMMLSLGAGLTYTLGRMTGSQKHGWAVWAAMAILCFAGVTVIYSMEARGQSVVPWSRPACERQAVGRQYGGQRGSLRHCIHVAFCDDDNRRELRRGQRHARFVHSTRRNGSTREHHDRRGDLRRGWRGALWHRCFHRAIGLYCRLDGRPDARISLGKKIESYDVKMAMVTVLIFCLIVLGFTAIAIVSPFGTSSISNPGPHGLSQVLYAYTSQAGNNGSAFAGLNGNTPWFNISGAFDMLFGRFFMVIPVLALAGNLARKKIVPESVGTFPVTTPLFTFLLVSVILIVSALTFFRHSAWVRFSSTC